MYIYVIRRLKVNSIKQFSHFVVRGSSVGIATRYRLDGPRIESRWGGPRFSAPVQTGPGAHPASHTTGTGSFPGVKRPGRGVDHPPPSSAEVKERIAIPLLPLWAFVACYRVTFTFTFNSPISALLTSYCYCRRRRRRQRRSNHASVKKKLCKKLYEKTEEFRRLRWSSG